MIFLVKILRSTESSCSNLLLLYVKIDLNYFRSQSLEPSLQLCTALRYFSQGGYLPVIADLHGISDRSASHCIHTVANAICHKMEEFMTWPTAEECAQTKLKFYRKTNGFPCIAGLIDGSQVPIWGPHPPSNEAVFVNRKGFHSINCQIVCDADMNIFSFDARWPGSSHDAYVLRQSEVFEKFEEGLLPNSWLLGDAGYALSDWLLTPYQNPNGQPQERYNAAHKRARCAVERCIGIWKMRWRCLTKVIMFQPDRASKIMAACAALHNLAIRERVDLGEEIDNDLVNEYEVPVQDGRHAPNIHIGAREDLVRRIFS